MSFSRPTLQTLRARISQDISSRLLDGAALPSRSVLSVLAWVWAGACHLMYGALAWYFRQYWAASAETTWLEMKASTWGVTRKPGGRASGSVTFTGTGTVPAGQVLRSASGLLYTVDADVAVDGTGAGTVTASEPGAAGNLAAGAQLQLVSPAIGVMGTASAAEAFSGGADDESDESLRARLLEMLQSPPRGGSRADYVQWATSVPGCTRAWCYPLWDEGGVTDGNVGVAVVADDLEDPMDCDEVVAAVQEYIDGVRPVTASVYVFAPVPETVDLTIRLYPATDAARAAVLAELGDLFVREAEPDKAMYVSHINEAISLASGEVDHGIAAITLTPQGESPESADPAAATIEPEGGHMFRLGDVTFTSD